jgi:hypothetical protein
MRYFLLILCVSFSLLAYGQNLKLGFRGGAAFSNFYGHYLQGEIPDYSIQPIGPNNPPVIITPGTNYPKPKYYYKTDFISDMQVGLFSYLFLDIELKNRLSVECGVGYSQKGIDMKYKQSSNSVNLDNSTTEQSYYFDRDLRLDYIVVPITFQYKIGRKQRFYILGGIYNSFAVNFQITNSLVTISEKTYNSSGQLTNEFKTTIVDDTTFAKIFDAGIVSGFGVNIPLTEKMIIGLDIRSAIGMVSVSGKFEEHGFQSFSENAKNISFETGLKLQYVLK